MPASKLSLIALAVVLLIGCSVPASAQVVETAGTRALGMGGAFVAVADDSSATWWNPAGFAAGPFLDMSLSRSVLRSSAEELPGSRHRVSSFAAGIPAVGFSYYRLRITEASAPAPDPAPGEAPGDPEGVVAVRSLPVSLLGITLVHTLVPGLHAGATLKYVSGTLLEGQEDATTASVAELLRRGEGFGGGRTQRRFDLDLGVMAVRGAFSAGGVVRNVRAPEFGEAMALPRQVRAGVAFDGSRIGRLPLIVSMDVDLRRYATGTGDRRVVAVGAEHWLFTRRLGVRGGGRFNTTGAEERAATAGASVLVRPGLYAEGHVVRGGAAAEAGWGIAARVSF